jgi:hypothetical protein
MGKFKYGECAWVVPGEAPHDLGPGRGGRRFCSHAHQQRAYEADKDARVGDLIEFIGNGLAGLEAKTLVDTLPQVANPVEVEGWYQAALQVHGDEQRARHEARKHIEYTPESKATASTKSILVLGEIAKLFPEAVMAVGFPAVAAAIRRAPAHYCRWCDAIQWASVYQVDPPRYDSPTRRLLGKACSTCRSVLTARPATARTVRAAVSPPPVSHPPIIGGNLRHQDGHCGVCAAARRILPSLSASMKTPLGRAEAGLLRDAVSKHDPVPPAHWRKITVGGAR